MSAAVSGVMRKSSSRLGERRWAREMQAAGVAGGGCPALNGLILRFFAFSLLFVVLRAVLRFGPPLWTRCRLAWRRRGALLLPGAELVGFVLVHLRTRLNGGRRPHQRMGRILLCPALVAVG